MLSREWRALLGIAIGVVIVSMPAWTGSWIYDDWRMPGNDLMDGPEDAARAFWRTSNDYLNQGAHQAVIGATYRPLSMLSLIAVQAADSQAPVAHHLVSLALHLLCLLGLFWALMQRTEYPIAFGAAMFVGLHPLGLEAYGWINGRSDVLAGAAIAWLAWALRAAPRFGSRALCFLLAMLAVLSKETSALAAIGIIFAEALPQRASDTRRWFPNGWTHGALALAGLASAIVVRAVCVGMETSGIATLLLGYESQPVVQIARLWALAAHSVFVPEPRTMGSLAQELSLPMSFARGLLLALCCAGIVALARAGQVRAIVLAGCAAASLVPMLIISHSFWHGVDRYLYMPVILLALALGESGLNTSGLGLRPAVRRTSFVAVAIALSISSWISAGTYSSQALHFAGMMRLRPEDPTGYLAGAEWLWEAGEHARARALLARMPQHELAPAIASRLATVLGNMGRTPEALAVMSDLERRHGEDAFVLLDVFAVGVEQSDYPRARRASAKLNARRLFCRSMQAVLVETARQHPERAAELARNLALPSCD